MKIKNDYVIIKNGKEEIKIHNMILNTYIKKIIENQFEINGRHSLLMSYVFLKFDTELEFDKTSILTKNDFDLAVGNLASDTEMSEKEIINNYMYVLENGTEAKELTTDIYIKSFENYNGRKITAVGFGASPYYDLYACVDVRNYNIYLDTTQVLSIARRDILSTDAIFYSEDKTIKCPVHLITEKYINHPATGLYESYYGILKSVGLGHNSYKMQEEHMLTPHDEHIEINGNSIKIKDELMIEYKSEGLFPGEEIYPKNELYPERIIINSLYPSKRIYPSRDIYPTYSAYQYVQLKYEIYYMDNQQSRPIDTGNYYLLSTAIRNKRKIKLNILYEGA